MPRQPEQRESPRRASQGLHKSAVATSSTPSIGRTADHFVKRLLLDCLSEQTAAYWNRRAEDFAAVGTPSCNEIARACRARAAVSDFEDHRDIVAAVLREVS